ncbi:MAG: hypothetical protein HKN47_02510 [Pirellulaceae bacterium]|nr:hypothetical protein [Pirellulaceae bacterium]
MPQSIHVRSLLATTCVLVLICPAANVLAVDPPAFGGVGSTANANEVAKFKGKLKGFQRGVLAVDRDDGTEVMVQAPPVATSLTFVAEAKMPFLRRGMLVRYSGTFGPDGTATTAIEKVEIFQPVNLQGVPGHGRDRYTVGVHPVEKHGGRKAVGIAKYTIVGNLIGINANGVMMVQAGNVPVAAPLAQNAQFELRYNNLSLAQEGDPVSIAGFYEPPDDTKIRGDQVTITTDRIYGEPTEAPPRRTRRSTRRTPPADTDTKGQDAPPVEDTDAKEAEADAEAEKPVENEAKPDE